MPGNEVGDRVHNFFAQDNLSQGLHNSQALDGNWPVLGDNLWPGSQRQVGLINTTTKNYNLQQSGSDRGQVGNPFHASHGLTFTQSSTRPEFAKSQSQSQPPNFNGFMYGNQFYEARQDETNFLAVDANSDRRNLTSRSLPTYGSQHVNGPENQGKSSVRSETSGPPVSFDFLGGQQQMNHQQFRILQSLQNQSSGLNDIQQLQQQVMLMKMQELQRQQQLRDARQQSLINQMPPVAKQASGSQPAALINGSVNSDALSYHWGNELGNANWLQRNPPAMQGSSNGLVFSPNQGQSQRMTDLVPQQVEQSLYGIPVSSSRGNLNQYPQMVTEKTSVQQQATFGNYLPGNHFTAFPSQVNMQDRSLIPRQRYQAENSFGHASSQALSTAIEMENVHQMNSMPRNAHMPEFGGSQEQLVPSENLQEKTETQDVASRDDVALDPTEERILFGSDDNIWAAFGKSPNMGGEGSNLFDGSGFNGFSSIQSGTWSALMQSAVAETSSSGTGLQEEMSGLNFQNNDIPSRNQLALSHNDGRKQQTPLTDDNLPMASSFASGTVPPSGDSNKKKKYQNVLGFQQFGRKFSYETAKRPQANPSQGLGQSSEDGGRRSNGVAVQKSGTEGSQMHGNASHSFDAESNASHLCNKPNDWNVFGSVTPYGDAGLTVQGSENLLQSNDQKQIMHREVVDSMWNSNSGRDLTIGLEQVKSALGSSQVNKEDFGLNNTAVLSGSGTMKAGEGSSQFLPNIYQLNAWKNADPLVQSKVGEVVGGPEHANNICSSKEEGIGLEMENSDKQENSNDSYRSNLSHHTSAGGQKENAVADAIDSRTFSVGKQKSSNQMGSKSMTSRKFHYHPMGNLDDGVEPPYGMKEPIYSQAMAHSVQPKFLGQVPKNSIEMGKGQSADLQRSNKGFDEAHCQGNFPGLNANISSPFNRSFDIGTQDKVSQSSQNMLELLHKVDQSREHAAMMHTIASESNAVSEMPQAENSDGSVGRLQRSQSSNSQGFGLQLGPPMQRLPIPNQSSSSQSSLQGISSLLSTNAASGIGQKGQVQLVPSSYVQAMPPSSERSLGENNRPGVVGQTDNETSSYRMPGNFSSAFDSGFPYSRGQLQSQDIAWSGGQLSRSLEKHASYSTQKDDPNNRPPATQSPETSFPDETGSIPGGNSVSSGSKQHSANILPGKVLALQFSAAKPVPVFQLSTVPSNSLQGTSSKALPNVWSNVAAAQHLLGAQYQKVSSQFSQSNQTNLGNSTSAAYLNEGDQQGNFPSEFGASSANSQAFRSEEEQLTKECTGQQVSSQNIELVQKMNETLTKVLTARTLSDGSPANSVSTQRDIEAFGRSLKPNNNLLQQNYSLLNQMQTMKNAEDDPSNRVLKRMRGPDSGLDGQLVPPTVGQSNDLTAIVGDALVPRKTLTSLDPTMLSFSAPEHNMDRNFSSQHGNTTSQSVLAFSREGSQSSNSAALTKVDHSKISPQMAPSWFNQYGTLKNGQILPMYDAHKAAILKTGERPFTVGKSSSGLHTLNSMEPLSAAAVETYQFGSIKQSAIPSVAAEYLSSQILPSDASGEKHPVISRTKKRKSATSELDPWHKEVLQGSRNLQTISMAEVEWAKAANRHIDKVEEDIELMEDGSLMLKPKRRLILTTQLMQQLFRPPPAAILSLDANLDYESVAYSISRLALSDACGVVSLTNDKSHTLHDSINRHSDDCKTSENVDNELLLKVIDDFTAKARKLENEFLRLDKRASVLDLIVECQDLEKFSVINRFARFHGRGQADNAEAASSSDAAANTQKPYPQRYVTALPLPRNLPTRVQCCSL